jgi:hypothetical protein
MARNYQSTSNGAFVGGSIVGTGSAANLIAGQGAGTFIDLTSLTITNATPATNAVVVLSDGTNSYTYNSGQPIALSFPHPSTLKGTTANAAWTLNGSSAIAAVATGVVTQT